MFIRCYADLNFGIKSYLRVNTLLSTCKLNSYIKNKRVFSGGLRHS